MWPKCEKLVENGASTSFKRVTSAVMEMAAPPVAVIPLTTPPSSLPVRESGTTFAPSSAIASAMARPIPRLAPVTTAT